MDTEVRQKFTTTTIRALDVVSNLTRAALSHIYHRVLLLGLPSHPRIVGRLCKVKLSIRHESPEVDEKKWGAFVRFILDDYKLTNTICWTLLLKTLSVAERTYNDDPVIFRVALIAILPPIFGIAQTACTRWYLKSTYREPDAPLNWCNATVCSALINTEAFLSALSAPLACMGWSIISAAVLLFAILFRGLPIIPCPNPQGSSPILLGLASLAFACHSQEEAQAFSNFSMVLCICMAVTVTAGAVHICLAAVYFTRLCLPVLLAASPMHNVDAITPAA